MSTNFMFCCVIDNSPYNMYFKTNNPLIINSSGYSVGCSANFEQTCTHFDWTGECLYIICLFSTQPAILEFHSVKQQQHNSRVNASVMCSVLFRSPSSLCCFCTTKWCLSGLSASQAEDLIIAAIFLWSASVSAGYPIAPLSLQRLNHHSSESPQERAAGRTGLISLMLLCVMRLRHL